MSTFLLSEGARAAYDRYTQRLSDALLFRDWVTDPSFALKSDSDLYEKILRDPVAAHAIRFRLHLVAGAEVRITPASDRPEDHAAATVIESLVEQIHGFTDARICLADAIFRGSAYAYISGARRIMRAGALPGGGDPLPQNWWVPERLQDVDRRRFRLVRDLQAKCLRWELWSVERRAWERLASPEWFVRSVVEQTEASLGYGRGLFDTLYYFQASKARVLQDTLRASERFGQGFIHVGVAGMRGADGRPRGGDERGADTVADAWKRELVKHRSDGVFVHDKEDEVGGLPTGAERGWQLLDALLHYMDNAQVTAVLGATLPTIQGDGGSRAMASVQENSTEALIQADRARLGDDLTRDLVGQLWRLNRAQLMAQVGPATMPRLVIDQRKREDPQVSAAVIATLLQAGVPLRRDEVYRKCGFTQPLPGDELFHGVASPAPLADTGLGLGGLFDLPPMPGSDAARGIVPGGAGAQAPPLNGRMVVPHAGNGLG